MTSCPFNSRTYLSGLAHLGRVETRAGAPFTLLKRPIEGTNRCDGLGAWPYVFIGRDERLAALAKAFGDLVTLTLVTQPGYRPSGKVGNAIRFKDHYIYDPARASPSLSKRTREHLRRAERAFRFEVVEAPQQRQQIVPLYRELRRRRGLGGGFFDFPPSHFAMLASLPGAAFFGVKDPEGMTGMACGSAFGDFLQLLHIAVSDAGLRRDAGYLLMQGVLDFAKENGWRLGLGGLPRPGDVGVVRFKTRWSNLNERVYLSRFVNDPGAYAELGHGHETESYFPAYRSAATVVASPPVEPATIAVHRGHGRGNSPDLKDQREPREARRLAARSVRR